MGKFKTIVADPPWKYANRMGTGRDLRKGRKYKIGHNIGVSYDSMTLEDICSLPVEGCADEACHLWLWTTNRHLECGFRVMEAWGFKYLTPIHWVKPAGIGAWFINVSQTVLFGYKGKCKFPLERYKRNVIMTGPPKRHSEKPEEVFDLIESISPPDRLEIFARKERPGWTTIGNEIDGMDIQESLRKVANGD